MKGIKLRTYSLKMIDDNALYVALAAAVTVSAISWSSSSTNSKIEIQGRELMSRIDAQGSDLKAQESELMSKIDANTTLKSITA